MLESSSRIVTTDDATNQCVYAIIPSKGKVGARLQCHYQM